MVVRFGRGQGPPGAPVAAEPRARGWVCLSAITARAARWVRDHRGGADGHVVGSSRSSVYGVDPDRLVLAGSSSGAHLAATAALTDPTIRGTICIGGYFGLADADDPQSSPIVHLTPTAPPFLVIHGDNDTLTTVSNAREFVESLRRTSGSAVVYAELMGAQHCFDIYHSPRMEAVIDVADTFGAFAAGP